MTVSARFTATGMIVVGLGNGGTMSIPDDMANRERRKLAAWEVGGGVIAAYVAPEPVPPPVDPRDAEIADLKAAVAALKKTGVLTDEMIAAEKGAVATVEVKTASIKTAGTAALRKA